MYSNLLKTDYQRRDLYYVYEVEQGIDGESGSANQ